MVRVSKTEWADWGTMSSAMRHGEAPMLAPRWRLLSAKSGAPDIESASWQEAQQEYLRQQHEDGFHGRDAIPARDASVRCPVCGEWFGRQTPASATAVLIRHGKSRRCVERSMWRQALWGGYSPLRFDAGECREELDVIRVSETVRNNRVEHDWAPVCATIAVLVSRWEGTQLATDKIAAAALDYERDGLEIAQAAAVYEGCYESLSDVSAEIAVRITEAYLTKIKPMTPEELRRAIAVARNSR